jgi:hypothetical protein
LSSLVCKRWEQQWLSSLFFSSSCFYSGEQTLFTVAIHSYGFAISFGLCLFFGVSSPLRYYFSFSFLVYRRW